MVKYLRYLFFATLAFVSCGKEDTTPKYFMTARIDGVKQEFNIAVGAFPLNNAVHGLVVIGRSGKPNDVAPSFSVSLDPSTPIQTKTYVVGPDRITAGYWYSYTNNRYQNSNDFSISVTSITEEEIKGSFRGKIDNGAGDILDVTDGLFYAKITR